MRSGILLPARCGSPRFLENGRPVLCVEVEARGRVFWELNNPIDIGRIEAAMAGMGMN